jgi:hypothetical protein
MVSSTSGLPERVFPWRFVIVAIVVTAVISGLVGYLGSRGSLGGVIPGERSSGTPPSHNNTTSATDGPLGRVGVVFVPGSGIALPSAVGLRGSARRRRSG